MKVRLTVDLAELETLAVLRIVSANREFKDRKERHAAVAEFLDSVVHEGLESTIREYLKHRRAELEQQMAELDTQLTQPEL